MKKIIVRRQAGVLDLGAAMHPLLQQIYSARGVVCPTQLERGLEQLEPFHLLSNIDTAVSLIVNAIVKKEHIIIIGDFDADGATSTAVAVKSLQLFGATMVSYLVPNRFKYGYGLSPEIVETASTYSPDLLITVDNGISSFEGVKKAQELGISVIITDHHLPPDQLPEAQAIVNPNLPGDQFPSKNLAGVGVIFYVLMAVRAKLRELNWFCEQQIAEPNMASFLDLVALGTVADVVPLDKNNRILVHQGLQRIRFGKVRPGIQALLEVAGRSSANLLASDLGFAVAPRLNAAGRLVDMKLGIECLLAEDYAQAVDYASQLNSLNQERQQLEVDMKEEALQNLATLQLEQNLPTGLCLYNEDWHQGIIGILAARLKELLHRPVIVFAPHTASELKGSGRSIPGLHLRDLLDAIATQYPGLIMRFGGHAMAAGLSLEKDHLEKFSDIFDKEVRRHLCEEDLMGIIQSDGELTSSNITMSIAELLREAGPWGQGFPEPLFDGRFEIISHRLLKEKHLKFQLRSPDQGCVVDAIAFNIDPQKVSSLTRSIHAAYRLDINEYRGNRRVQLMIEHFEPVQ